MVTGVLVSVPLPITLLRDGGLACKSSTASFLNNLTSHWSFQFEFILITDHVLKNIPAFKILLEKK